jgi:hypothetical protein
VETTGLDGRWRLSGCSDGFGNSVSPNHPDELYARGPAAAVGNEPSETDPFGRAIASRRASRPVSSPCGTGTEAVTGLVHEHNSRRVDARALTDVCSAKIAIAHPSPLGD